MGRPADARPWIERAVALPDDGDTYAIRLWAAADAMLRDDATGASYWLARVEVSRINVWYIDLYHWIAWYIYEYSGTQTRSKRRELLVDLRLNLIQGIRLNNHPCLRKAVHRKLAFRSKFWLEWIRTLG
ncbi:MAG: hypothetical protein ABL921_00695 [Pirellula sp.]